MDSNTHACLTNCSSFFYAFSSRNLELRWVSFLHLYCVSMYCQMAFFCMPGPLVMHSAVFAKGHPHTSKYQSHDKTGNWVEEQYQLTKILQTLITKTIMPIYFLVISIPTPDALFPSLLWKETKHYKILRVGWLVWLGFHLGFVERIWGRVLCRITKSLPGSS